MFIGKFVRKRESVETKAGHRELILPDTEKKHTHTHTHTNTNLH